MRLILSFAALFLSVILLQLSSGGVGPLDVLSGTALGFSATQIGLLGSAHFLGFFIGCWWAPRLMGAVGHSRSFAAFTALGGIGLLGHTLTDAPWAWAVLRVASGLCIAGAYTVIEAWLQAKVTNATRGRAMGTYRMVDIYAQLAAQLMIGFLAPASYVSYNLLALLCCAALLPLTLTRLAPPHVASAPRLQPLLAWRLSPLAVGGVIVAGIATAAFRMIGPLYGAELGLRPDQIGYFLAAFVLGGALMQWPMGWIADRYDRRWVLIWISLAAILASGLTVLLAGLGTIGIFVGAFIFGSVTFPIYSVSAAHAHDWADDDQRVELSAALIFFYAIGAIVSPLLSSQLIDLFGPRALFFFIGLGHLGLVAFGLYRMRRRATSAARQPYVWIPRTSFQVGRLFRRGK
ncbi:MAG: MFS transporter [Pseudomonadota bacterium]